MTVWYAVQGNREDAWDNGSHDLHEAVQMLAEQGSGLIAVVDEDQDFCLNEIDYEKLFGEGNLESSVYDKDMDEITLVFYNGLMARGKAPEESFEYERYFDNDETIADFMSSSTVELPDGCSWEELCR